MPKKKSALEQFGRDLTAGGWTLFSAWPMGGEREVRASEAHRTDAAPPKLRPTTTGRRNDGLDKSWSQGDSPHQ